MSTIEGGPQFIVRVGVSRSISTFALGLVEVFKVYCDYNSNRLDAFLVVVTSIDYKFL